MSSTPYPIASAVLKLSAAVLGAIGLTAIVLAGVVVLAGRNDWWVPLGVATIVSLLAALLSMVPIVLSLGRGPMAAATGHFIATGVRVVISIGGCFLAVKARGLPAAPTMLLMVPYYFAVLAAESTMLALFIRKSHAASTTTAAEPKRV